MWRCSRMRDSPVCPPAHASGILDPRHWQEDPLANCETAIGLALRSTGRSWKAASTLSAKVNGDSALKKARAFCMSDLCGKIWLRRFNCLTTLGFGPLYSWLAAAHGAVAFMRWRAFSNNSKPGVEDCIGMSRRPSYRLVREEISISWRPPHPASTMSESYLFPEPRARCCIGVDSSQRVRGRLTNPAVFV